MLARNQALRRQLAASANERRQQQVAITRLKEKLEAMKSEQLRLLSDLREALECTRTGEARAAMVPETNAARARCAVGKFVVEE